VICLGNGAPSAISVQDNITHWPFKVVDGRDYKPLIQSVGADNQLAVV